MLIDTHCHLYKEEYNNLNEIIDEIKDNNMIVFVNGCDPNSNKEAIELANNHNFIYATIGFHPQNINDIKEEDYIELEKQLENKKVIAIGEIGLDYYWNKENKEDQIIMFRRLLDIAKKYNKPVIIHSREATQDVYEILSEYKLKGILHAFSGSVDMAKKYNKLGYLLGIGGVLTFKNSNLKDVIKEIDLEYIVLETDSPYLTPEPYRGKPNKPIYVSYVVKKIEEITGKSYEEVCNITTQNVYNLFDLKPQI